MTAQEDKKETNPVEATIFYLEGAASNRFYAEHKDSLDKLAFLIFAHSQDANIKVEA